MQQHPSSAGSFLLFAVLAIVLLKGHRTPQEIGPGLWTESTGVTVLDPLAHVVRQFSLPMLARMASIICSTPSAPFERREFDPKRQILYSLLSRPDHVGADRPRCVVKVGSLLFCFGTHYMQLIPTASTIYKNSHHHRSRSDVANAPLSP